MQLSNFRSYRIVWAALLALLVLGAGVTLLVQPPSESSGPRVVDAVELTGRIRLLIDEAASACLDAARLNEESLQTDYDAAHALLAALDQAAERLEEQASQAERTWVPVEEAVLLLEECREQIDFTRSRLPRQPVPVAESLTADPLETDPQQVGLTAEASAMITRQVRGMQEQSAALRQGVERAVLMTSLSREALWGFEVKYLLLILLCIATVAGAVTIRRAEQVLQVPPERALETHLKLLSRVQPKQAIEECYEHSRQMLQVADEIVTVSRLSGRETGSHGVSSE
jgi:hypothetical protein